MPTLHDPYLDTVRRSLNEEKIKIRKKKIKKTKVRPKSFFSKNIILSDYIYIPENLQNLFLMTLFIGIPYILGTLVILVIFTYETFKEYTSFTFDMFMFTWTVGYESIALLLLLLIMKSAFTFRKN